MTGQSQKQPRTLGCLRQIKIGDLKMALSNLSIFPQSLDAYVGGSIVGKWIDPSNFEEFEEFEKEIQKVTRNAEEVMIADTNGADLGEYPNLPDYFEFCNACEASDIDTDILIEFANDRREFNADIVKQAEDSYIGEYDSFQDYADQSADEQMACCGEGVPQFLMNYFDYESYARDLEYDFFVIERMEGGNYKGVAIFYNH